MRLEYQVSEDSISQAALRVQYTCFLNLRTTTTICSLPQLFLSFLISVENRSKTCISTVPSTTIPSCMQLKRPPRRPGPAGPSFLGGSYSSALPLRITNSKLVPCKRMNYKTLVSFLSSISPPFGHIRPRFPLLSLSIPGCGVSFHKSSTAVHQEVYTSSCMCSFVTVYGIVRYGCNIRSRADWVCVRSLEPPVRLPSYSGRQTRSVVRVHALSGEEEARQPKGPQDKPKKLSAGRRRRKGPSF